MIGVFEGRLARLDPATLRPLARGSRMPRVSRWAHSPRGGRVAVASGGAVLIVDARRLRVVRRTSGGGPVRGLAWPAERRVVAVSNGRITTVDPVTGRIVRFEPGGRPMDVASAAGTVAIAYEDGVAISRGGAFATVDAGLRGIRELALSPDGRFAVAFAGARAARIDTASLAVARADVPLPGAVVDAEWSGTQIAVATERADADGARPGGAYLVDPATWRVRTLDPEARGVSSAGGRVLVFGHVSTPSPYDPDLYRTEGIGVRGYDAAGNRRFHVLGRVAVAGVAARGRYAYVQVWARAWLAVVDLRRGTLARRTVGARTTIFVG